MIQEVKHIARLLGYGGSILAPAVSGAGAVYAILEFVIDAKVSFAQIGAAIAGIIIGFAFYSIHAEHIRRNLAYLRRHNIGKSLIKYIYLAGAVASLILLVMVTEKILESHWLNRGTSVPNVAKGPIIPNNKSIEPRKQVEVLPSSPTEKNIDPPKSNGLPHAKTIPLSPPRQVVVCDLKEQSTPKDVDACEAYLRKHPPRTNIGPLPSVPLPRPRPKNIPLDLIPPLR